MSKPLIEILIPTFNREKFLLKNLGLLFEQIQKDRLNDQICISISDNASTDNTESSIEKFKQDHPSLNINYSRNESNIGLEPNAVSVLKKSSAPYILWLGDDDYLPQEYLSFLHHEIKANEKLGCVIPGLSALKADGASIIQRKGSQPILYKKAGFEAMLDWSHLSHQMSGILLKNDGLFEAYMKNEHWRNPYLFIFQTANQLLNSDSIFASKFQMLITDFNEKDWGYNEVGLLDEVFKSYYPFTDEIGEEKVGQLMLRFSILHSYRYNINKFKPRRLIQQYKSLIRTSLPIKGFAQKLRIHLFKDYLISLIK